MRFRFLGPLKEGLFSARGPDPGGRTARQVARQAFNHAHPVQPAHHHQQAHTYSTQALSTTLHSIFQLLAPAVTHAARTTVRSGPTSARFAARNANAVRPSLASGTFRGASRPAFNAGFAGARQPVHQVGLGTARGFATGAGRPVLQNIQNAPQYIRALADQKDRLGNGKRQKGRKFKKGAKSAAEKGKMTARKIEQVQNKYFPSIVPIVSEQQVVKTAAIVLKVPLEPATAIESDDEISSETSSDQGHLLNAAFLRVLRHREEQLLRAQHVFEMVQDSVQEGTARCKVQQQALVVRFDQRQWSVVDVRALLGLWDTIGETWYRMGEEAEGWVESSKVDESDVSTIGSISIDLDSPSFRSPVSSPMLLSEPSSPRSEHSFEYDLRAHDHVVENLQLPSIMFGASFMQPPASTYRPSPLSRSSTGWDLNSEMGLDSIAESSEDEDYERGVRKFIDKVDGMRGAFPSQTGEQRSDESWGGWTSGGEMDLGSSGSTGSWRF